MRITRIELNDGISAGGATDSSPDGAKRNPGYAEEENTSPAKSGGMLVLERQGGCRVRCPFSVRLFMAFPVEMQNFADAWFPSKIVLSLRPALVY